MILCRVLFYKLAEMALDVFFNRIERNFKLISNNLPFGDGTEVAMSSYFSTGFDDLETKFENFLKSFER